MTIYRYAIALILLIGIAVLVMQIIAGPHRPACVKGSVESLLAGCAVGAR